MIGSDFNHWETGINSMSLDNLKEKVKGIICGVVNDKKALAAHKKRNHPCQVVFLMKNTCNSKCIMCGLNYANNENVAEISLADYKVMLGNLNMDKVRDVTFSGGGDPLLCKDLMSIIDYTNQTYPDINLFTYTNGIALSEKFARAFIKHNFCQIYISVNAETAETYRKIMQVDAFDRVIANIRQLVKIRNEHRVRTKVQLGFVASKLNIDDLPGLINLGVELGVDGVNMIYCRFYSKKFKINVVDYTKNIDKQSSLFFHQVYSDEKIKQAECIAKEKGIDFSHEPLFNAPKLAKKQCPWSWRTILVGPQGAVYPCGGGEVMFYKAVKEGRRYFGNLLKEHGSEFWNNEDFNKLRQSCDYRNKDKSIPQCWSCNYTIHQEGVKSKRGHFIDIDL